MPYADKAQQREYKRKWNASRRPQGAVPPDWRALLTAVEALQQQVQHECVSSRYASTWTLLAVVRVLHQVVAALVQDAAPAEDGTPTAP